MSLLPTSLSWMLPGRETVARRVSLVGLTKRLSIAVAVGALVAFHAVLLGQRIIEDRLFELVPAVRWLAAAALAAHFLRLYRKGVPLLRGRVAVVIWMLVLLLHVLFWGPAFLGAGPEVITPAVLPVTLATLGLIVFTAVARSLRLLALARNLHSWARRLAYLFRAEVSPPPGLHSGFHPSIASRPPPLV